MMDRRRFFARTAAVLPMAVAGRAVAGSSKPDLTRAVTGLRDTIDRLQVIQEKLDRLTDVALACEMDSAEQAELTDYIERVWSPAGNVMVKAEQAFLEALEAHDLAGVVFEGRSYVALCAGITADWDRYPQHLSIHDGAKILNMDVR